MASPTSLALECRHPGTVRSSCASANHPLTGDLPLPVHKLEHCLSALEEERRKIGAFLRELPLCMQLLQDAIEAYTEQLTLCKPSPQNWHHAQGTRSFNNTDCNLESSRERALMEEFIPAKWPAGLLQDGEEKLPRKMICKPTWVEQCGILEVEANSHNQERCLTNLTIERGSLSDTQENAFSTFSKPYFHSKNKSGGAFMPFSRNKQVLQCTPRLGTLELTDLVPTPSDQGGHVGRSAQLGRVQPTHNGQHHTKEVVVKTAVQGASRPHKNRLARKARRCWSTELHYRFVNALQQLGGSQVATPKQIRELMKVEGLTNDEVKSHLQKYRLHTQRPRATQVEPTQPASELVMLDGIWVPSDCMARPNGYQTSSGLYSQQPTSSQELGSELQHMHHPHHHHHHHNLATSCRELPKIAPAHS